MERATIAGGTIMTMITLSSLVQDSAGIGGNLAFTLLAGFALV